MEHKMPVIYRREGAPDELVWIDIVKDIVKIEIEKRSIVFHTVSEKYYPLTTLYDFDEHFSSYGYELLDKCNLVNMNQVRKFEPEQGKVYFETEIEKDSKFAHVAAIQSKLRSQEISKRLEANRHSKPTDPKNSPYS